MVESNIQEVREYLVLLILGTSESKSHTMLQLQKEFFYLWRSSSKIKPLVRFIAHYKGPFSESLRDSIMNPVYLSDMWNYYPPKSRDNLTGGKISLNDDGINKSNEYIAQIKEKENKDLIQLIAGMRLIHDLYDDLSPHELLYMVYINPNNKDFIRMSEIYNQVINKDIKNKLYERIKDQTQFLSGEVE